MRKWFGVVGYGEQTEIRPGVWREIITERELYGDILNVTRRVDQRDESTVDTLSLTVRLSVVADEYAVGNAHKIRYAVLDEVPWRVASIEPNHPRLILNFGEVWNGQRPAPESP